MKSNLKTEVKDAMACAFLTTVHGNLANSTTLETTEALSFLRSENISANDDLPPCTPCTWTKLDVKDLLNLLNEKSPVPIPYSVGFWPNQLLYSRVSKTYSKFYLKDQQLYFFEKKENKYQKYLPQKISMKYNEQEATIIFEFPERNFYMTTFHPREERDLANEIRNWTISRNEEWSDYEESD
eukprot:GHVP01006823.1.p1 GENE.GHVP01006823.1~~GHVP01006823.1.p1  ORF type:complete len:183 (-),score=28.95 GHVP01006823.1:317-865(-)